MPDLISPEALSHIERRARLMQIFRACADVGMSPVAGNIVHAMAYLADALAPVWRLPVMDGQVLKRRHRPFFPTLQDDLDWLVGAGILNVERLDYSVETEGGEGWRLAARYNLHAEGAARTLELASTLPRLQRQAEFVREVVLAASGLGDDELSSIGDLDAAYSYLMSDLGGIIDLETWHEPGGARARINLSAAVAVRFSELAGAQSEISESEMLHLYVRHLYSRVRVA